MDKFECIIRVAEFNVRELNFKKKTAGIFPDAGTV